MSYTGSRNISLEDSVFLYLDGCCFFHDCQDDIQIHWKIQRADGQTEVYTVLNETYTTNGRDEELPDRGLYFEQDWCYSSCQFDLTIHPTDLRYDGAQITGVLDLPECFEYSIFTESITLNIQGITDCTLLLELDEYSCLYTIGIYNRSAGGSHRCEY